MHNISEEEIAFILNDIQSRGVTLEDLQENLLDHVCCIIETEMLPNEDFYEFYESIIPRFFKKELKEYWKKDSKRNLKGILKRNLKELTRNFKGTAPLNMEP